MVGMFSKSSVSSDFDGIFFGVRSAGVFRRTNGDGVDDLWDDDDDAADRGLGVRYVSRTPMRPDAKRLAAGDIEASRSNVDRMYGDAIFLRASSALAFWSRIRSPAFSASANASDSRLEVSAMWKEGPATGRNGVSDPSKRNGVPSSSPHVMRGLSATPGCGDGVLARLNALRLAARADSARVFPSMPTRLTIFLL